MQSSSTKKHEKIKLIRACWSVEEHNLLIMVSKLCFSKEDMDISQIQELFRHAFKNKFFEVINYLLSQLEFCKRLILHDEDCIMMAFSIIIMPNEYSSVVNLVLYNIKQFNDKHYKYISNQLNYYNAVLNNVDNHHFNFKIINSIILKVIVNFTTILLSRYHEKQHIEKQHLETISQLKQLLTTNHISLTALKYTHFTIQTSYKNTIKNLEEQLEELTINKLQQDQQTQTQNQFFTKKRRYSYPL